MADARRAHFGWLRDAFGRNDFQHRAVWSTHKIVAVILVVDAKPQDSHIPFREPLRVGRGDRSVFQTCEHKRSVYQAIGSDLAECAPKAFTDARKIVWFFYCDTAHAVLRLGSLRGDHE